QISIFMSIWNVHVNWHPIDGSIKYFKYHPGKYLLAKHPKSSLENERTSIVVEKTKEQAIMVRQIAGAAARRIVTYANIDQTIKQAEQLGIIKFGSRVDVFLPLNTRLNIKLKDSVKAQESILGYWK
ncbi:MAG: phosphatidylserine decarboxylase, partial [Bacteroidota bacterium]